MFNKILIANRGEIAVRIINACKEMNIATVAIYSEADKDAMHVQLADEKICVGKSSIADSYLNMQSILSAACVTKSQAIHPGFGFLSENAKFADMCKECNIKFIGPSADSIDLMGNKLNARNIMKMLEVPVIPGSDNCTTSIKEIYSFIDKHGLPILLKACAGGGGRGISVVNKIEEVENVFTSVKNDAISFFKDDAIYIEKIINDAKHIEVQVLCDEHGNCIHLLERDCSLQIRRQKIVEEAPAVFIPENIKKQMYDCAIKVCKHIEYIGAGTFEFLYKDNQFYFLEMNTRIQVEHPVTEMITNVDIVKEQIKIAYGYELDIKQEQINLDGHSIECRINVDFSKMKNNKIENLVLPSGGLGLRIDNSIYNGYKVPPFYDSMLCKVITKGEDRLEAIAKMKRALEQFKIQGIETNIDLHLKILNNNIFVDGDFSTNTNVNEVF